MPNDENTTQAERDLRQAVLDGRIGRRELLRRGAALGLSVPAVSAILAACGGGAAPNPAAAPTATSAPAPTAAPTAAAGAATTRTGAAPATRAATSAAAPTTAGATTPAAAAGRIPAPANKRDLIIVQGADVDNLNPQNSTQAGNTNVSFNIFDNLLFRDGDGKLQPMLATEYRSVDDTTWEFKLRPGVKFHNGDPLTAADVKFSIERTYNPEAKTLVSAVFATVAAVETPDDLTVRFKTKAPDPLLPARLAFYGGQIMPKAYFERVGPDEFNQKPVGAGPLRFVEQVKDDRLVLEANKDYWGGAIAVDRVIFRPRKEVASRVSSLLTGEADLALDVPPDQVPQINRTAGKRVETTLYAGLYALGVNSKQGVLGKPEIKQALAYGVDRKTIIDTIWGGQGALPSGMIPQGSFAFDPSLPPIPYDPDRSRALLRGAGYANEEIVIESTQGYFANDRLMGEAIAQGWRSLGINIKLELIEVSVRSQKNRERSFRGMWWTDPTDTLADPAGMSWRLLQPGGAQDYWRDARWDQLGAEANATLDMEKRKKNYDEMNRIFLQNFPWIPILQPNQFYGLANYVEWRPYSSTYFNLRKENLRLVR